MVAGGVRRSATHEALGGGHSGSINRKVQEGRWPKGRRAAACLSVVSIRPQTQAVSDTQPS